jgi:hypothetical protein
MYPLFAFPLPSPTTPVCNCLILSANTQSYGTDFVTDLTFDNYFDCRKYYLGYDPCCDVLRPIEIKYNSITTRWEIYWDSNLQAYLSGTLSCPTGTTWTNIGAMMTVSSTSATTCPEKRAYTQPNYIQSNECSVLTIHPMTAFCEPTSPADPNGYGSLGVTIIGGTPPYSVTLLNSTGNVISNIPPTNSSQTNINKILPGTYFLEITDQFGDFQLLINCTILAPTTTTTTTLQPLPPTPSYFEYNFCITLEDPKNIIVIPFITSGFSASNNVAYPTFRSPSSNEIIYWDLVNQYWVLSASTLSDISINYNPVPQIVNTTYPLPTFPNTFNSSNVPINNWIVTNGYPTLNIMGTRSVCALPTLFFIINEGWWQVWNSNIPNQYRGTSCGGQNQTPYFQWQTFNLPIGVSVTSYEILCINTSTSDVYFDVTNISPLQGNINNNSSWLPGAIIGNTVGGSSLQNSNGWQGPCSGVNYSVTMTANLSSGPPLTNTIYFIYCTSTLNGICVI